VFSAAAAVERSLSLSVVGDESRQSSVVRLVRSCTVHLLRMLTICCARHANNMPPSTVNTLSNLLHALTVSGHHTDSGKLICHVILTMLLLILPVCVELTAVSRGREALATVNNVTEDWTQPCFIIIIK